MDPNTPHYDRIKMLYPEIATDPQAMARADYAHKVAVSHGCVPGTEQWMQFIKWSRGAAASQGDKIKAHLLPQHKDAAKWSHCDEDEYAVGLAQLQALKRQGYYRDR